MTFGNIRPWKATQIEGLDGIQKALSNSISDQLYIATNQSGKSGSLIAVADALTTGQGRTIIIAPTASAINALLEEATKLGIRDRFGVVNESSKEFDKPILLTTGRSLIINVENGKIKPDDFQGVLLDEAHLALGEKTLRTLTKFQKHFRIGFSATPEYCE